jgi:hypothetical protein
VVALLRHVAETYDAEVDSEAEEPFWISRAFPEDDEDMVDEPIVDNEGLLQEILETLADAVQSMAAA